MYKCVIFLSTIIASLFKSTEKTITLDIFIFKRNVFFSVLIRGGGYYVIKTQSDSCII